MQLAAHGFALGDHLGEFVAADGFAQGGLRAHVDGVDEVLNFKNGFLGVPDHPEDDGVDVHRDSVAGERGFGGDTGDANALIHIGAERLEDRDDVAHAGAAQSDIASQAEDCDLFPLLHDLDREQKVETDQGSDEGRSGMVNGLSDREADHNADDEQQAGDATDFLYSDSCHDVYLLLGSKSRRRSIRSSRENPAAPARAANSPAIIWPSWRSRSAEFFSSFLFAMNVPVP